jgi:hypothetical protein
MKSTRFPGFALVFASVLLAGCGKNSNPASPLGSTPASVPSNDQAAVTSVIAAVPQAVEDGLADLPDPTSIGGSPGMMTAIQPLNYWRTIRERDRTFEFVFSDPDPDGRPTTAVVTIRKRLVGQFNILVGAQAVDGTPVDGPPATGDRLVVRKPLEDHWVRRVLLKRIRLESERGEPRWRIAAISGVKVTSKDATTTILSLRIQAADKDTTIVDPLAFQRLRRILRFEPGTRVVLTVTTGRNDDVVVLHHRDHRFRFRNNGDNTYTGVWPTGLSFPGLGHFGVNALSNGTLFDDQAPYDSQSWLFAYALEPANLLAEFLP